ncbi:alanine--tRNA ligase [bacterium]|nr:alanine--tRNA ligase [bacterium]
MDSSKLRSIYLDFFKDKEHTIVHGSGLVPFDDATILFTNAGMVQFKKFWATDSKLPYSRAVTCQKCVRAGGKDSDFDKIGVSNRHHTFFEMLGNFSFGDYFKKEAIDWAYEFVIELLKLPIEKIWATYYKEDIETKDIWKSFLPETRIVPLGKEDNFWGPAGETGPCGPCTELYMDFGEDKSCGPGCLPGCNCDRFLEFWNIVFPQFDRQSDGSSVPLKRRGVDTGMGLERMIRIMQNVESNYETDLFLPIIKKIEDVSGCKYLDTSDKKVFFRRVADHIRAVAFLIDDNILPSNEARGYVLRRIIRRATVSGFQLGIKEPFLYSLSEVVVALMGDIYPTLKTNKEMISKVLREEEDKYRSVIESASRNFQVLLGDVKGSVLQGKTAFKLYDTFGVPVDIIEEIAFQKNIDIDWDGFNSALEEQKKKARSSTESVLHKEIVFEELPLVATQFTGYKKLEDVADVKAVYFDVRKKLFEIVFDRSPFYPEKGGQIGDRGVIENCEVRFVVLDTTIDENGLIHHIGKFVEGQHETLLTQKQGYSLKVDAEFRTKVSANHTATHLLHYALREIVGKEVKQAGSYVADDRFRFDFICSEDISSTKIEQVEKFVQDAILQKYEVVVEERTLEEVLKTDVIALFTEKYEENVRVINISKCHSEICGGTHVENTCDILIFKITGFSSIGKNLKRIEAVTYKDAISYLDGYRKTVVDVSNLFETIPEKLLVRVEKFLDDGKKREKVVEKYENILISMLTKELISEKEFVSNDICSYNYINKKLELKNSEIISKISDKLIESLDNCISFIADEIEDKVMFVVKVGDGVKKEFPAVKLAKEVASILGGKAGGSEVFARGSGKNGERFLEAANKIRSIIQMKGKDK